MDKGGIYSEIYNTSSDTNDVLHVVIERLKKLPSYDLQDDNGYGGGIEEYRSEMLEGDYVRTEDIKKLIDNLEKDAL